MANKYLDHDLYTYAATPTWNVAQEGDGTGTGAATPAVVSVDMTGWTFSTASTVSVMGATAITCTSSATSSSATATPNAQYSATLTTMIDNLVTAINLHSGNAVNIPSGWTAHQVRNSVFARRSGNSLELMTRAGSASWNSLTALAFTNVTGSSSQTWASGAGGAWGWLWNMAATIWPSAIAIGGYGALATTQPLAGTIAAGDVVHVRNANKSITHNASTVTITTAALGTEASPVKFVFGDTSVWTGDGADDTFTVSWSGAIATSFTLALGTAWIELNGGLSSTGGQRLILSNGSTSTGNMSLRTSTKNCLVSNVKIEATGTTAIARADVTSTSLPNGCLNQYVNCAILMRSDNAFVVLTNTAISHVLYKNCVFDATSASALNSGVIFQGGGIGKVAFETCTFTGFVSGSKLLRSPSNAPTYFCVEAVDNSFGNVTDLRWAFTTTTAMAVTYQRYSSIFNRFQKRDFVVDWLGGYFEFIGARSYPTLNAVLPDGSTPWVWRFCPTTVTANINKLHPAYSPRIIKENTLGQGIKTVTAELAINEDLTWTKADIALQVAYQDKDDIYRVEDTYDSGAGALSTSSVTWSSESGGQVVFDDGGGNIYFDKKKITLTTTYQVKASTEISAQIVLRTPVSTTAQFSFVDPDVTIASVV